MTTPLIPDAKVTAAMQFAMTTLKSIPRDDPEALEAHITAVLVMFWGALWGTFGTEYARDFISSQLRGMTEEHDTLKPPRVQ